MKSFTINQYQLFIGGIVLALAALIAVVGIVVTNRHTDVIQADCEVLVFFDPHAVQETTILELRARMQSDLKTVVRYVSSAEALQTFREHYEQINNQTMLDALDSGTVLPPSLELHCSTSLSQQEIVKYVQDRKQNYPILDVKVIPI